MNSGLRARAESNGVAVRWYDIAGTLHEVPDATLEAVLVGLGIDPQVSTREPVAPPPLLATPGTAFEVPGLADGEPYTATLDDGSRVEARASAGAFGTALADPLPMGLHEVAWEGGHRHVLVAPERCLLPAELGCARSFGISAQLYGLRTRQPSAIGDFGDLRTAAKLAAEHGSDLFGLSPLHTLFMADAHARSPYSPSHRAFVNPLYIDVGWAAERLGVALPPAPKSGSELLDYPQLADVKKAALEGLFERFRHACSDEAFRRFRVDGGESLELHCRFEALHEAALAVDPSCWAFWTWPTGWRRPDTPEVEAFVAANAQRIAFFAFLQWLADMQLEDAQAAARDGGMRLGLYCDLAVGVNPAGSMAWSTPGVTVRGLTVGAPPDPLGPDGQNWGLAPFAPTRLAALGFRPLLDDLDANARHAGAIRIDHVLGFARQFWIPEGASAHEGTYVEFPFDVMARLCSLVSHRRRCVIVGEDLGTVPEGFRDRLRDAGMLSCRVLWFERDGDRFRAPNEYPEQALASVSTHDLPTVRGFFAGSDVDWRADLGGDEPHERATAQAGRTADTDALRRALDAAGFGGEPLVVELHRFLAASASTLALVQLEDVAGVLEQPNLPGTVDEHPNWQRRLPEPVEDVFASPLAKTILEAMRSMRPRT